MFKYIITIIFIAVFQLNVYGQIAVKADTIYTMAGNPIANGVILIRNGKIENVGANLSIPQGYTTYTARVVTPGLIDVRSSVGLSGAYNVPSDQDQIEKSSPLQPELRAIDAYNPEDKLLEHLKRNGITTIHTGHGVGALSSGQTMIVKTKAGLIDDVMVQPIAMVAMTLGPAVSSNFTSPGTRSKQVAMLRAELLKAQGAMKPKDTSKAPDLRQLIMQQLLRGEVKALISANTATDIMSAIRLAKEFNLKLVIEGGAEAYRLIDQIKASKAEIIVHPTMARPGGEMVNMTMENAAILSGAGIPVSIESGFESYVPKSRVVLYEAAAAMIHGLSFENALRSITIHPAKLLGLEKRVGSIEKGKDADLVLFNGDPFEYTTKACIVIIDGKVEVNQCQ
ncbi:MAG: amidohydrolase family protein [Flavisolibacter sp.]|nr:amidohydrolase family protein [Flavisolibacter sp.]